MVETQTQLAPAQEALRFDLCAYMLERLDAALMVIAKDGAILFSNARVGEVLGIGASDLCGQSIAQVAPELGPNTIIGFRGVLLFQDLTRLDPIEAERDRLLKIAAVNAMLPARLHEIKNPLGSVVTSIEVLLEECGKGRVQEDLHAILDEVRRIELTLEGLGPSGRELRSTRHSAVDLALNDAFTLFGNTFRSRGITSQLSVATMPLLPFDPAGIRALVFNLVSNAMRACSEGGEIALVARLTEEGTLLDFTVLDTGCGMSPEVLSRCREVFFSTRSHGSGIGLTLCDRLIAGAGGTMTISSEESKDPWIAAASSSWASWAGCTSGFRSSSSRPTSRPSPRRSPSTPAWRSTRSRWRSKSCAAWW